MREDTSGKKSNDRSFSAGKLVLALAFFAGWAGSTSVPARATDLRVEGGPGGAPFRAQCPAGRFLVGVSIRSGAWLDAIFPLCAGFLPDQRLFAGTTRGSRHGGTGGSPLLRDGSCPSDHAMVGMKFGWTRGENSIAFVDYVEVICQNLKTGNRMQVCLQTGHGCWDKHPNPPPPTFPGGLNVFGDSPFVQNCPNREAATGLRGRSGSFVDALGLICSPLPLKRIQAKP